MCIRSAKVYESILIGIAVVAAVGLIGNGLVAWRQQAIHKNDIAHLKIETQEFRHDIQWLTIKVVELIALVKRNMKT